MSPFVRLSFAFRSKMPPGEPQQPKRKKDKSLRGAILYGPRDVRFDERATPSIIEPTDAIISLSMTCICGSDLWPYRGLNESEGPTPMGHEYCGIVEEIGSDVTWINRGQFVIGCILRFGQHVPALSRWLSNFVRAHAAGDWSAVTHLARPARRRHVGGKRIRELPITPDKLL